MTTLVDLFPDSSVREVVRRVARGKAAGLGHRVSYDFLDENKQAVVGQKGTACFSGLWKKAKQYEQQIRYLRYAPDLVPPQDIYSKSRRQNNLSKLACRQWIALGQELGILDEDREPGEFLNPGAIIDLKDPNLTISMVNMKLNFLRFLREEQGIVRGTLDLVNNAGRDFWASLLFCQHDRTCNHNHSIIPCNNTPGHHRYPSLDVGLVVQLYLTCNQPKQVDSRPAWSAVEQGESSYNTWHWHKKYLVPKKHFVLLDRHMMLSSELVPVFGSGSFDKAAAIVEKIDKRSKHVRFGTFVESK